MHLPRRSALATTIALCLVAMCGSLGGRPDARTALEPGRRRVPSALGGVLRRGSRHRDGDDRLPRVRRSVGRPRSPPPRTEAAPGAHRSRSDRPSRATRRSCSVASTHGPWSGGGSRTAGTAARPGRSSRGPASPIRASPTRCPGGRSVGPPRRRASSRRRTEASRGTGPRSVPARSEGPAVRHPRDDRRWVGRVWREPGRRLAVAGGLANDRRRHHVDAASPMPSHQGPSATASSTTVTDGAGTTTSPTSSARPTAGATWHDLGSIGNGFVADVWFVSDTDGFTIVGTGNGSSRLMASTDGGASWSGVVRFPAT